MIGPRLSAVLSLIGRARVLADIGTDHAYVPVAACLSGMTQTAIACDIKPGPLDKARGNISQYRLQHRIETRLGDGLAPLAAGEADCIVIAGMGGMRIAGILAGAPETANAAESLILQPQHDITRLRRMLHEQHFAITDESMVREDRRFYTVLAVRPQAKDTVWTETEYLLGRHLLARKDPVLYAFLTQEMVTLTGYINKINPRRLSGADKTSAERSDTPAARLAVYQEVYGTW